MPECPSCQENIKHGWSHCPHCGANLKDGTYNKEDDPFDKLTKRVDKIDEYLTTQEEERKKKGGNNADPNNPPTDDGKKRKRKTLFGD